MRTYFTVDESSCPTIQGKQPKNWQAWDYYGPPGSVPESFSEDYPLGDDLLYGTCEIKEVDSSTPSSTPNYLDFPNIQELFVDFGVSAYVRNSV